MRERFRHCGMIFLVGFCMVTACALQCESAAAVPPMTQDEQALAQQLDGLLGEMTKGLSEQEKEEFYGQFNNAMDEELDKIDRMDDEQFARYVQDAESKLADLSGFGAPLAEEQPVASALEPSVPASVEEPKKVETKKPEKLSRDMTSTIDEIAARLLSFLQEADQVPEMAVNFKKWGQKGKLHNWKASLPWDEFRKKVEALESALGTIKSIDVQTHKPKYLTDLAAETSLCDNLVHVKDALAKHCPCTKVPSFGLKKMSSEGKAALIDVINDCLEALTVLDIPGALAKIIEKYEPTAHRIKEAEEKAQKAAMEASKRRPSQPGAAQHIVGHGGDEGYFNPNLLTGNQPGYHGYEGYGPSDYRAGQFGETPGSSAGGGEGKGGSGGGAAKDGKKGAETGKSPEGGKKDEKKEREDAEAFKALDAAYESSMSELEGFVERMESDEFWNDEGTLRAKTSAPTTEFITALESLTSSIKSFKRTQVSSKIHSRLTKLKGESHTKQVKRFQALWRDYKPAFDDFIAEL